MLFRKNKINKNIKQASENTDQLDEFESLNTVNQNRFVNKVKNKLNKQYHDGIVDVKDKYNRTLGYTKSHWFMFIKVLLVMILISSVIIGSFMMFSPFFAGNPGDIFTPVNNFYLAASVNGNISFSISNLAIAFVVLFVLLVIIGVFYFVWATKHQQVVIKRTKSTFVISIISYILIGLAVLMVAIGNFIPPQVQASTEGQQIYTLISIIKGQNVSQSAQIDAIRKLYELCNLSLPSSADPTVILEDFNAKLTNGVFNVSSYFNNYYFLQNVYLFSQSTLSVAGIVCLVFIVLFFSAGLAILPFTILIINMTNDYRENNDIKEDWNGFKVFIFTVWNKISNFCKGFVNFFKRPVKSIVEKRKEKNKKSFKEYKKNLKEQNVDANNPEKFSTDKTNNSASNVITKEEIEKHAPNKAFLNSQGQWMYHDGNGKYFIVKNDTWIPFDINASIHVTQVNVNTSNEANMSKKVAKESKIFKNNSNTTNNNKGFDSLANKTKKEALIDIPDEELDKIINELDI